MTIQGFGQWVRSPVSGSNTSPGFIGVVATRNGPNVSSGVYTEVDGTFPILDTSGFDEGTGRWLVPADLAGLYECEGNWTGVSSTVDGLPHVWTLQMYQNLDLVAADQKYLISDGNNISLTTVIKLFLDVGDELYWVVYQDTGNTAFNTSGGGFSMQWLRGPP